MRDLIHDMAFKDKDAERAWFRARYARNISQVVALKLSRGCADCGYNDHSAALEFDHILPHLRGSVASQMGKSWKVIMEEIDRCEVVCANCHQIREYDRREARKLAPIV